MTMKREKEGEEKSGTPMKKKATHFTINPFTIMTLNSTQMMSRGGSEGCGNQHRVSNYCKDSTAKGKGGTESGGWGLDLLDGAS